jgi:hypothetical protein
MLESAGHNSTTCNSIDETIVFDSPQVWGIPITDKQLCDCFVLGTLLSLSAAHGVFPMIYNVPAWLHQLYGGGPVKEISRLFETGRHEHFYQDFLKLDNIYEMNDPGAPEYADGYELGAPRWCGALPQRKNSYGVIMEPGVYSLTWIPGRGGGLAVRFTLLFSSKCLVYELIVILANLPLTPFQLDKFKELSEVERNKVKDDILAEVLHGNPANADVNEPHTPRGQSFTAFRQGLQLNTCNGSSLLQVSYLQSCFA